MKCHLLPVIGILSAALTQPVLCADYPPSAKKPVTDEYHGVKITEDYRWLEQADDPAVKAWTEAQNKFTRTSLDKLPERAPIAARLEKLFASEPPSYGYLIARPGRIFAWKYQPPKEQQLLVTLTSVDDLKSVKVVLDPNELEPKGQVAMDWYVPSADGAHVAVSLSENGSEEGTLHFFDTTTGAALPDKIVRVQYPTGGGSAAWAPDGKTVFYTRYPRAGERPDADLNFYQQVFVHKLGTPDSADVYAVGKNFPRIAEIELEASEDGRWLIATVANGDGGEFDHHLLDLRQPDVTAWRQITRFSDGVKAAVFAHDGSALYLRSVKDAPRGKVLRMPISGELKDATLVVPESEVVIEGISLTSTHLYVTDLVGGPSQVRRFDLTGDHLMMLPLAANSGAGYLHSIGENQVVFRQSSFTEPDAYYLYDSTTNALRKTALATQSPADFSDIETVRELAVSKDGTRIPISILRRKGIALDGSHPLLLSGYGGYGISMGPYFEPNLRLWFDAGGVYAMAHIRGGGEYGEDWHLAGNLTKKQNCFDDFAACARHLIERGYTRSEKLATEGASNGGLLMGAFMIQNPALARAVISHVGIYDMIRVEMDPNGEFNVTEFGTVKNPDHFKAIHAYSPYHHVVDGTAYPSVFFLAGETDGRVNPANSRKMTARLQAANPTSKNPVLVRLSADSGHGMGTARSEAIQQQADVFAFLFDQLGMKLPAPAKP